MGHIGRQGGEALLYLQTLSQHNSKMIVYIQKKYQIQAVVEYLERINSYWEPDNGPKQRDTAHVKYILWSWRIGRTEWDGLFEVRSSQALDKQLYLWSIPAQGSARPLQCSQTSVKASLSLHLLQVGTQEHMHTHTHSCCFHDLVSQVHTFSSQPEPKPSGWVKISWNNGI